MSEERILSETVRANMENGRNMWGDTLDREVNSYMNRVYGSNWQRDEAEYISKQNQPESAPIPSYADYDETDVTEIEGILKDHPEEDAALASALVTYPGSDPDELKTIIKAVKVKIHEERKKSDSEYAAMDSLSENDKKALKNLQKHQPEANWTAQKFKAMMY